MAIRGYRHRACDSWPGRGYLSVLFLILAIRVTRDLTTSACSFLGWLRGALALALALGLPPEIPGREDIIAISFAVVAFSVFVQGLTMVPFLRKLGEIPE
jgi:NhaP-type Na+/H+ or K+/H+ antiporter